MWVSREVKQGEPAEPSLKLPYEVYVALREHFSVADADKQISDHRDDAVKVRDRLLTLVERLSIE